MTEDRRHDMMIDYNNIKYWKIKAILYDKNGNQIDVLDIDEIISDWVKEAKEMQKRRLDAWKKKLKEVRKLNYII